MDYVFNAGIIVDISDVEKDIAIDNVKHLLRNVETVMHKFEASPNYHQLMYKNTWVNHPDSDYVESDVFKKIFDACFGDISLQHFLTEYKFDRESFASHASFRKLCSENYLKLSFDEVECVQYQLTELYERLCALHA